MNRWAAKTLIIEISHEVIMETDYWRVYYDEKVAERSDEIREEIELHSTGVDIHVDVYSNPNSNAPVVIFNHGAAGYCRLFVQLALLLYERGYTVVLPDQRGCSGLLTVVCQDLQ